MSRRPSILSLSIALCASCVPAYAATYTWNNATANWGASSSWQGFAAPTGTDPSDILVFGGTVSSLWTATNTVAATPFQLSELRFGGTGGTAGSHTITGGTLRFVNPSGLISINGNGSLNLNSNVVVDETLTVGGTGDGRVTLNGAVSGFGSIVKNGASTLRFGTLPPGAGLTAPSLNTWLGTLVINAGNVQFNNNAQSGSTSLRANAVTLSTGATLLLKRNQADENDNVETSLRLGALSGNGGTVTAQVINEGAVGSAVSNYDVVITALSNGIFAGTLTLPGPVNSGDDNGNLVIRGTHMQTFTGTLNIFKDVHVGAGATLKLGGTASLSGQSSGAIVLAGGTVILDNSTTNANRLRDGTASSTGLEPVGGGTLNLVGSLSGTTETVGRLQLGTSSGSEHRPRAGALNLKVTHLAGNSAATELRFQSYARSNSAGFQYATVNFSAENGSGTTLPLGNAGNAPRILIPNLIDRLALGSGLLNSTAGTTSVGWATVNGESFASYDSTLGVIPVTPIAWPGSSGDNTVVTGNANTSSGDTVVNSIKIAPSAAGQALNITGGGNLSSAAYLLAGGVDFVIKSTGGGGLTSARPRFFYVQQATLSVQANVAPEIDSSANKAVVKSGPGVLELTHPNNVNLVAPLVLNEGTVRANYTTGALPGGEIQMRGGVLEIAGGGTFTRQLGATAPSVNWSSVNALNFAGDDDRGSGGFAAFGADVTVSIMTNLGLTSWEDSGFVRSGYALVFGSKTATHRVTWSGNLGLTDANSSTANYNAREIRVVDNPNTTGDWARITGAVSGGLYNDLVKNGDGTLELANSTGNSYLGATMIQQGTLLVNTNNEASFAHVVKSGAILGGNGRVGNVRLESGGILSPGSLAGRTSILRTKDLSVADSTASLVMELGGTTPGGDGTTGYDQLQVTGTVELNGTHLDLQRLGAFSALQGDLFFLILNDGQDPVEGQFAEGSQIVLNGQTFAISYTADSDLLSFTGGNDVALTVVPEPSTCLLLGLGLAATLRRRRVQA